ncbi:RusA family crossover junction endodeoxyribonuclease [Streptomyces sp. NPDC002467]|uniref:RusA family crossover junction endodeoxyribonuclease n=1 Tax=Streptomyces sp. NPDC002467 TaxID=3364647 RepID=UPI0036AB2612
MSLTLTPAAGMPALPAAGTNPADLTIVVLNHRPAPQGSKRHVGQGHLIEQSRRVKPWRAAAEAAARAALTGDPLDGPLSVEVAFTVRKPASAPRTRITWPTTRDSGDLDKLLRSTFDALTSAGTIADDSRIVEVTARKMHPGEGLDALDAPGAVIRIWQLAKEATR